MQLRFRKLGADAASQIFERGAVFGIEGRRHGFEVIRFTVFGQKLVRYCIINAVIIEAE